MKKQQMGSLLAGALVALTMIGSLFFKQDTSNDFKKLAKTKDYSYTEQTKKSDITLEQSTTQRNENIPDEAFFIPRYNGKLSVVLNNNEPVFADLVPNFQAYYVFSDLDELGRVGSAEAVLGPETLPIEKRKSIRQVTPSGWHQNFYSFIDQQALYTRAHLIAHQLCGENANPENLMTGTNMFNKYGMLPYENMVKTYIKNTHNHVQYRVTPVFGYFDYNEKNLVADGVQMEAKSVEDNGKGVKYNVFVYNVETGVDINYLTGENKINKQGRTMGFEIRKKKAKN